MEIIAENIVLRDFKDSDFDDVLLFTGDEETMKFMTWGPLNGEETIQFIKEAKSSSSDDKIKRLVYNLAIENRSNKKVVGGVILKIVDTTNREATLGYCLSNKFLNKGYALKATQMLCRFAFEELKMHRIVATCDTRNYRSIKLLEKMKFTKEGILRKHQWLGDHWRSSEMYSLLDDEFENYHVAK